MAEVIFMLSNEARAILVKTYEKLPDAKKIADIFSVSLPTVYRLLRQMRDTGSVELKTNLRGRKPALSAQDIENIRLAIEEQPDITIHEIRVNLNLPVSDETVRAKVVEMGFRLKKKHSARRNRTAPMLLKSGNGGMDGNGICGIQR